MVTVLTDAQQKFVDGLKMQNTDHRAIQIVVAAMHVRNASSFRGFGGTVEATDVLKEVVDKVAG